MTLNVNDPVYDQFRILVNLNKVLSRRNLVQFVIVWWNHERLHIVDLNVSSSRIARELNIALVRLLYNTFSVPACAKQDARKKH
ncbi:hypothetical protein SBDP1_100002 [Syntrophobacter sp. SbD1]|nr:hypothetical protein SBDP1_100002 [Syntrophobacter sp. SbD1]